MLLMMMVTMMSQFLVSHPDTYGNPLLNKQLAKSSPEFSLEIYVANNR